MMYMYYRIAWKQQVSAAWQWKSTRLTSQEGVSRFFWFYRAIPRDRLRVFSSSSPEGLNELLALANSTEAAGCALPAGKRDVQTVFLGGERGADIMYQKRLAIEMGVGGDHDVPYTFALPVLLSQRLAWVRLLARVQRSEFAPDGISSCNCFSRTL
jgi:hypothetical protein